jgi:hypothetical protein
MMMPAAAAGVEDAAARASVEAAVAAHTMGVLEAYMGWRLAYAAAEVCGVHGVHGVHGVRVPRSLPTGCAKCPAGIAREVGAHERIIVHHMCPHQAIFPYAFIFFRSHYLHPHPNS